MKNDLVVIKMDKLRTVKLTNKAMKMLEKSFNCKIGEVLKNMDNLSVDEMYLILHAGLIHEDKELTMEKTEELLDEYCTLGDMLKLIVEAFKVAMGVEDAKDKLASPNV